MHVVDLSGTWELATCVAGAHPVAGPGDLEGLPLRWIPARVPGNVELDLERAGALPELFRGTNIYRLRELEGHEWWYRRHFDTPPAAAGRAAGLVFHGLDCFATVWLNGREIGRSANMLVEQVFEVTGHLAAAGDNELVVRLGSALNEARARQYPPSLTSGATNYEHLHVRKAPHMYGWDIMPRAVGAGIWRPVHLELRETTEIGEVYYTTRRAGEAEAVLLAHWQVRTEAADLGGFRLRFEGHCADHTFRHEVTPRFIAGTEQIHIPHPRLWWPRGYGEASLYEVTCQLVRDGEVVDERRDEVGLRTVVLERTDVTTPQRPGQFRFVCNGEPIFCKGSNWVPADAFHSRDAGRYEQSLSLFDDLGCTMVRCWGGNVYEDHAFYRHCDRTGMLVWQDFAFACGQYPQDAEFLEAVRREAEAVVRKLRNHPCIALWSGDNEVDDVYMARGLDPGANRLTREVLPEVCRLHDPWRSYLPSSPFAAPEVVASGDRERMPEQHLWGPRDYYKSPFYARHTAHFASEIGYHGCPNVSSIRRFIDADHLWPWPDNDQWRCHAESGQTLLEGDLAVPANGTQELGRIRASRGEQRLWLIEWKADGQAGGNHYLLGTPPFSFEQYRAWLPRIAALPHGFAAGEVAR